SILLYLCFFFQAEDGIRDPLVTGVQTCALPIYLQLQRIVCAELDRGGGGEVGAIAEAEDERLADSAAIIQVDSAAAGGNGGGIEIGRASCRERGGSWVGGVRVKREREGSRVHGQ